MRPSQARVALTFLLAAPCALGCGDDGVGGSGGSPQGGAPVGGSGGGSESGGAGAGGDPGGGAAAGGAPPAMFSCDAPTGTLPELAAIDLGLAIEEPVQVRSPPGRPDTLFVVERTGAVRVIEDDALLSQPFLDLSQQIRIGPEEGVLGLVFHPEYEANGRLFIHYSKAITGASTVEEYARSANDADRADPGAVGLVLSEPTAQPNHNGGALEFGPDGQLYISLGDGGGANDPECDAQSTSNLLGKILRVDVEAAGYPAATGNPGESKIFHLGLRNPWRISFDPCNGDLYMGDVGQGAWEEIDVATSADGPLNFGWPLYEGDAPFANDCLPVKATLEPPIATYDHGAGCSVTGGVVYRGNELPALRGAYLYGDFCTGAIWMLRAVDGMLVDAPQFTGVTVDSLVAFGEDGRGEVFMASLSGGVFRLGAAR